MVNDGYSWECNLSSNSFAGHHARCFVATEGVGKPHLGEPRSDEHLAAAVTELPVMSCEGFLYLVKP
jgi:hypothetical protein